VCNTAQAQFTSLRFESDTSAMTVIPDVTVFDNYTEELIVLFEELESRLVSASPSTDVETTLLKQCQEILQQMSVEARSAESMKRKFYMEQYQSHKKHYETLKQQIERSMVVNFANDRKSTGSANLPHLTLQSAEQSLVNQNTTVSQSLKSIHETEQIAIETMEHLQNQKNTLEHSRENTKSLQSLTQQANQIATNLLKPWWRKGV
jgi:Vesicle transport v-SNARE protein N-terminus